MKTITPNAATDKAGLRVKGCSPVSIRIFSFSLILLVLLYSHAPWASDA
jgi:hypothetical protein